MQAVVYEGKNLFVRTERPVPALQKPTDALVRVTLASICSSDLHIKGGYVPRAVPGIVVGHEMVGVVEAAGSAVTRVRPGDRVAVNVETFCGSCFFCQRGFVNNCTDPDGGWALGCRIDGGQAEYVRVPYADTGLTPIPPSVSDRQALFTGDLLSTGFWAAQISEIAPGDTVAVLGAGPTGLCAMMCARRRRPARIIAVDPDPVRRALALEQGWADAVLDPAIDNVPETVRRFTAGRGADAVIEAAGGKDTFQTAWQAARPNGTVCVVAMYETPQVLPLPEMYGKNLTFKTGGVDACRCGEILGLIAAGKLDATPLITHTFPLADALDAYELFAQRRDGVVKIALQPQQPCPVYSGHTAGTIVKTRALCCAKSHREASGTWIGKQ